MPLAGNLSERAEGLGRAPRLTTRHVDRWLLAGAGLCMIAMAIHRLFAFDIWWQIAAGRYIATHGIPSVDPFSFGFPAHVWIEPRWLWCLAVHGIYASLGVNALILFKVVLLAGTFGLFVLSGSDQPRWAAAFGAVLVLASAHERFMVRPELISFFALMTLLLCVRRHKRGGSPLWIWALPVLQVVWCNAHTLWVLGPVTLWIVVFAEIGERVFVDRGWLGERIDTLTVAGLRRLTGVAIVTSLVTLVNPYFVRGVLFPFGLFREIRSGHLFSEAISEFRSPFSASLFANDFRTAALIAVIVISALGFVANRRHTPLSRLALWGAYLFLAVEAQRNGALFGWIAGWVTMLNLGQRQAAGWSRLVPHAARLLTASFVLVMVPAFVSDAFYRSQDSLRRFGFGVSEHRFPVSAVAFVRQAGLPTPFIHSLGDGGYVMFEGGPSSVYADGRLEVYGADALERVFLLTWTGEGIDEESTRTGAETVVVPNDMASRPLVVRLESSPEWVPVYFDPLHLVYVRRPAADDPRIRRLAIDWAAPRHHAVEPPVFHGAAPWLVSRRADGHADERLGSLFLGVGNYPLALEHFERAHAADPDDPRSRLFLAWFREAQDRSTEAERLLRGVPNGFLRDPQVHTLAATIDLWAENPEPAVEHLRRARELGATEPEVSFRLARAALLADDLDTASETLDRLAAGESDRPDLWNLMAVLELKRHRPAAAVRHFERSLTLDPAQDDVRAQLLRLAADGP